VSWIGPDGARNSPWCCPDERRTDPRHPPELPQDDVYVLNVLKHILCEDPIEEAARKRE